MRCVLKPNDVSLFITAADSECPEARADWHIERLDNHCIIGMVGEQWSCIYSFKHMSFFICDLNEERLCGQIYIKLSYSLFKHTEAMLWHC